jgi:hypothetical protein
MIGLHQPLDTDRLRNHFHLARQSCRTLFGADRPWLPILLPTMGARRAENRLMHVFP